MRNDTRQPDVSANLQGEARNSRGLPLLEDQWGFRLRGKLTEAIVEQKGLDPARVVMGRGVFGQVDVPTANGRVYRRSLMERERNRIIDQLRANKVFGELDHPSDGRTLGQRVSHLFTDFDIEPDGTMVGEIAVIRGTRNGDQAISILEAGGLLGVSSRGFGTTTKDANQNDVVNDDYNLLTFDMVVDPAAASAYPEFDLDRTVSDSALESRMPLQSQQEHVMDLKELRQKYPHLIEQAESESAESYKKILDEQTDKVAASAEQKIEEGVKQAMPEVIEQVQAALRKQYENDPKLAGAIKMIESIRPALAPFILGGDAAQALEEHVKEIAELRNQLSELRVENLAAKRETQQVEAVARRALLKLHLERRLGDFGKGAHPCSVKLRTMVAESIDERSELSEVDQKIEKASGILLEEKLAQRAASNELVEVRRQLHSKKNELAEAEKAVEALAIRGYVSAKVARHPAGAQLAEAILRRQPKTKSQIDQVYEETKNRFGGSELFQQVRRGVERRSMKPAYEADRATRQLSEGNDSGQPKELAGVPIADIMRLATEDRGF